MRIASATSLLAFAALLDHIEPLRAEPRTLSDLFPRYNGVLPPVEEFRYQGQLRNFETLEGYKMMRLRKVIFFKRGDILFGWSWGGNIIRNPCRLFPHLKNVFIVFDVKEDKWITSPRDLSRKLGVTRRHSFVVARDQVAAIHVSTSNDPVYKRAHVRACKAANDRVDIIEQEQAELMCEDRTTVGESIRAIKEEYSRTYDSVFTLYLYHHGEYNINGHRGQHT